MAKRSRFFIQSKYHRVKQKGDLQEITCPFCGTVCQAQLWPVSEPIPTCPKCGAAHTRAGSSLRIHDKG